MNDITQLRLRGLRGKSDAQAQGAGANRPDSKDRSFDEVLHSMLRMLRSMNWRSWAISIAAATCSALIV